MCIYQVQEHYVMVYDRLTEPDSGDVFNVELRLIISICTYHNINPLVKI